MASIEELEATVRELAKQLRRVQDKQEIEDCILRYSRGVDRLDREALLSCYHEDGVDDHGVFIGSREEFADWAQGMHRRMQWSHQHCQFNHTVEIEGDTAHAETYFLYVGLNRTGVPFSMSGGRYIDRLERRDGTWAIAARKCVRDWIPLQANLTEMRQANLTAGRDFLGADEIAFLDTCAQVARDRSDPSYERPLTIDPARFEAWRALKEARAKQG